MPTLLKIGKMTSKELAIWFGISYGTFRNQSTKYLEKLKDYANFEKTYGGVLIQEIYISIYDKHLSKKNDLLFLEEIKEATDSLMTISGLARKVKQQTNSSLTDIAINKQLTKSRDRMFGASSTTETMQGICGGRKYIWAIKISDYNEYRCLTQAEEELFNSLITNTYSNIPPEQIKQKALLDKAFKQGDISKEDYFFAQDN